jgi:hypothetical protein
MAKDGFDPLGALGADEADAMALGAIVLDVGALEDARLEPAVLVDAGGRGSKPSRVLDDVQAPSSDSATNVDACIMGLILWGFFK